MYSQQLTKPDGRALTLYARQPFEPVAEAPSPVTEPHRPNAHMRWHPLRDEWVAYAGHRQHRTFLPPKEFNPLAPTTDPANPTELPQGDYDIAVFDNLFPTLTPFAHDPPAAIVDTRPAHGACEVVVFSQNPHGSLGALPLCADRAAHRCLGRSHQRRSVPATTCSTSSRSRTAASRSA